jgi:hypothetical protein
MRYWTVVGLLALMGALWTQTPKSVIGFETPQHGWLVLPGAGGKVELTENPNDVKSGKRALRYTYTAAAGKLNAIIYLEPELWAQGFRFWIKADRPALFALSLQEQGGERWVAPFWVSGNEWQRVTIALADFTLAEDTKPVNNKLDMDTVEGLGLIDVSALFARRPKRRFCSATRRGRTCCGWTTSSSCRTRPRAALRPTRSTTSSAITSCGWRPPTRASRARRAACAWSTICRSPTSSARCAGVAPNALRDTKGVEVVIQVKTPTTLAVFVEEQDGERWSATFEAGGERKPEAKRVLWSQFTITDDTKGKGDGKLTPATVKMLSLADWGALTEGGPTSNRWLVQSVRLVK